MGLLDTFSDKNEKQGKRELTKGFRQGYKTATGELKGGYRDLKKSYGQATKAIGKSTDAATGEITAGRDAALGEYDPYVESTAGAPQLYSDALGLGGAEGSDRAVEAFRAGPGYDFRIDQGVNALQRLNASRGRLDSGNTMIDVLKFAGGEADQEYGSWLDRLRGEKEFGAGIAGARAGIYTGAAGETAGLLEREGTRKGAIKTGLGDVQFGLGEKMADLGYSTKLGLAATKSAYLNNKDQTGLNVIGAITGGARAVTAGTGATTGTQSLGSRLLGTS